MPTGTIENEQNFVRKATELYGPGFQGHLRTKGFDTPDFLHQWASVCHIAQSHPLGPRVLDLGCGPGWTSIFLAGRGCQVTAMDVSADMLGIARENAARLGMSIDFRQGDMQSGVPQESFDTVTILDALHHCHDEQAVLRHCFAALRPGGRIVLIEPDWFHEFGRSAAADRAHFGTTERGMGFRRMKRALKAAGFVNIERHYTVFGTCSRRPLARAKTLLSALLTLTVGYPHHPVLATALRPNV